MFYLFTFSVTFLTVNKFQEIWSKGCSIEGFLDGIFFL